MREEEEEEEKPGQQGRAAAGAAVPFLFSGEGDVGLGLGLENPQHERFVWEYFKDYNGSAAAVRSGFSPGSARQTAYHLLLRPDVAKAVRRLRRALSRALRIDAFKVLRELSLIAFSDVTVYEVDRETGKVLVPPDRAEPESTRAIASVKVKTRAPAAAAAAAGEGEQQQQQQQGRSQESECDIKMHNKIRALELLGKYLKLFDPDGDADQQNGGRPGVLVLRGVDIDRALGVMTAEGQQHHDDGAPRATTATGAAPG